MLNFKIIFAVFMAFVLFCIFESTLQYSFYHVQASPARNSNNTGCIVTNYGNYHSREHWQLVYEDNFRGNSTFHDWYIRHETTHCNSHVGRSRSCKSRDNVRIIDGHLVLQASRIPQYSRQFTGSEMKHKDGFSFGRYEIRAAHPVGAAIVSDIRVATGSIAYIDVSNDEQNAVLQRGTQLSNGTFVPNNLIMAYNSTGNGYSADLHKFNVYGLEWNQTIARLFVNEHYSSPLQIDYIPIEFGYWHTLVMSIYISGQESQGKTDLLWTCPAMIVDYIRIFQRIYSIDPTDSKCTFRQPSPDSVIDGICTQVMESMTVKEPTKETTKESTVITNYYGIFIAWLVILSCLIIICLALLLKLTITNGAQNSWIRWRWTNGRESHQENHVLNDGFVRSTEIVS